MEVPPCLDEVVLEVSSAPAAAAHMRQQQVVVSQRVSSNPGGVGSRLDPDVATLSLSIDQHMQALTKDAVDHLLAVKARLQANLQAAVDQENEDGNSRLAAKQAEADAVAAELKHAQQQLVSTELALDRVAGGYAAKQRAVYDRLNLLRSFYVWREWAQKERKLQYVGVRLQQWYVRRWLLGRAWGRWLGQARLQYRTLVAERAEKQQKTDAAALHAIHSQEAGALRAQIEGLQQQLQEEAEARNRMEEEMKRSFMRGVTAINLEALQMMRRGAPPSGANPFPVALPLNAETVAAGLVAAADGQQQGLVDGSTGGQVQDGAAEAQGWGNNSPAEQARTAAGVADGAAEGYACAAADTSAQAQSEYGAAAVVRLQQPQQAQRQAAMSSLPGLVARGSSGGQPAAGSPKVFVERGPAGAAGSPQKAGVASPAGSRAVGVRRALQQGQSGSGATRAAQHRH